ncbi:LuxR C-terminal-related transcriptional regulator [Mycobacterium sp. OTB74]|uniref:response regulator transcription factor n=1 Tax=Mycobacterium sp. OTB74 TaxID=1853452 RepID=UPI0024731000|nr:LuxR C-terminal-related transcriptional regulator [Mycobacterium sp. OTB74]MDH6246436.1 DNA-binding CsgD family transcriptional regulator/GAF domain-containing protein [Mycobacterium sp. OTB74]
MVLRAAVTSLGQDSTLAERVEATLSSAAEHLGSKLANPTSMTLAERLAETRRRLERRASLVAEDDSAATDQLLISILLLQSELLDRDLSLRVRCLSEIRTALADLRGLSPSEIIHAAPVVLSRELAFARTMISTVRGSLWLPQYLHIEHEESDPRSKPFREYVEGAHFQLADAPLETELVRKRCGALVLSPVEDKRTFKGLIEVAGCRGYVAAPITVQGRAIGMLHADQPEPDGILTMDHLNQLEAFAECLSVVFESAVLEAKAVQQRVEVGSLCAHVDEMLTRPTRSPSWLSSGEPEVGSYHRTCRSAALSLTAREREIMAHVATGATNGQIARCLVISEGTVKSHLKHIAKKLNTSSRAAAVAVYGGIMTGDYGELR